MRFRFTALSAALLTLGAGSGSVMAQSSPEFKFSGFGTLAAVHSSDDTSDFKGTLFQPKGAGHTRSTSFDPDSKLGVQLNATFNDKVSGVVQVVSQYGYDNSYAPRIEWANVKLQATQELSLRAGRIAAPAYMLSESRFVGYANTWARPPVETYGVLSITSNDGIDATYRKQIFGANHSIQAYYGKSRADLSPTSDVKSNPNWGINDTVEFGSLTLRAGYNSLKIDVNIPSVNPLFGALRSLSAGLAQVPSPAFQTASVQAAALADKYSFQDMKLSALALGASYDPGHWFVTSEYVLFKGAGFLSDQDAWYASGGYRFGAFTPYVAYSSVKAHIPTEDGIATAGLASVPQLAGGAAALNGAINATLKAFTPTQHTITAGVRWDFMKNVAAKAQFDRVTTGAQSNGRLVAYPGFQQGSSINLATLSLDFVF